jgi:hypothetical protein
MAAETPAKNRFVDLLGQAHKTLLHNELELFVQCSFNNLKAPPEFRSCLKITEQWEKSTIP